MQVIDMPVVDAAGGISSAMFVVVHIAFVRPHKTMVDQCEVLMVTGDWFNVAMTYEQVKNMVAMN